MKLFQERAYWFPGKQRRYRRSLLLASAKSLALKRRNGRRLERDDPNGEPPYQVAILDDVPRFLRGLVLRAIRNGVPERLHKRFLIVFENGDVWKRLARFLEPDDAYVLVIGAGGKLLWRIQGRLTEEHFRTLLQMVRTARLNPSQG